MMVLDLDPAALGGLAGLIALCGWALGRMQGGLRAPPPPPQAAPAAAADATTADTGAAPQRGLSEPEPICRQRAQAERRALHAAPVTLAELHAEAVAIRRDSRIFAEEAAHADILALPHILGPDDCRYLGRSGQPTCPAPLTCAGCGGAAEPQLAAAPASLTRV